MGNKEAKRYRKIWRKSIKARAEQDLDGFIARYKKMRVRYWGLIAAVIGLSTGLVISLIFCFFGSLKL